MKGYLYQYDGECSPEQLGKIIAQPAENWQPADPWLYLEHEYPLDDDYAVHLKRRSEVGEAQAYQTGRLFDEQAELRWQRVSGRISLHLLCENEKYCPKKFNLIETFEVQEGQIYLWGTYHSSQQAPLMIMGDAWIETRIPRPLYYPVGGESVPSQVQIKTWNYCQQETGLLRITRWAALEELSR